MPQTETVLLDDNGRHVSGHQTTAGFAMPADANTLTVEINRAPLSAQGIGGLTLRFEISYDGGLTWPADYDYSGQTQYPPGTPIADFCEGFVKFNGFNLGPGNRPFNRITFMAHRPGKDLGNRKARVTTDTPAPFTVNFKLSASSEDVQQAVVSGRIR